MKILAIETSCDETGIAVIEARGGIANPRFRVIKNLVASQIKIHRPFGGVVPNLAKREHMKNLPILLERIENAGLRIKGKKKLNPQSSILNSVDLVAVTVGPGLEPALWTGINFAEEFAKKYKKMLLGVNHLEGHLYSFLLTAKSAVPRTLSHKQIFPAIALIVSGGHTILLKLDSLAKWKKLGETRDDAAGEAFDKVARLLELPYPGGPEIEKLSRKGNPAAINFPRPMLEQKNYDFSFSGLKTSVLYYLRDLPAGPLRHDFSEASRQVIPKVKADIAASFQQATVDVLVAKTIRAAREYKAKSIILSGGVAANKFLRKNLGSAAKKNCCLFLAANMKYNLDNAAMIAAAGYMALLHSKASGGQSHLRKKKYPLRANGNLNI